MKKTAIFIALLAMTTNWAQGQTTTKTTYTDPKGKKLFESVSKTEGTQSVREVDPCCGKTKSDKKKVTPPPSAAAKTNCCDDLKKELQMTKEEVAKYETESTRRDNAQDDWIQRNEDRLDGLDAYRKADSVNTKLIVGQIQSINTDIVTLKRSVYRLNHRKKHLGLKIGAGIVGGGLLVYGIHELLEDHDHDIAKNNNNNGDPDHDQPPSQQTQAKMAPGFNPEPPTTVVAKRTEHLNMNSFKPVQRTPSLVFGIGFTGTLRDVFHGNFHWNQLSAQIGVM